MGWLGGDVRGKRLLCLAAGGGRQGPIYAAAGAEVTVVDLSPAMLELDREVSNSRKLKLRTVEASMDDLSMFGNGAFDLVIHPVSTCYVSNVRPVFQEVARVMVPGGIYVSQHKQPTSMQAEIEPNHGYYRIRHGYYDKTPLPPESKPNLVREDGTLEYVHRWEELIGAMCEAGFAIEALTEPMHAKKDAKDGSFAHRCGMIAPYVRVKARRMTKGRTDSSSIIVV
jgi:ubiquinone/menaquinone biosynthesis C-methylase UbiE